MINKKGLTDKRIKIINAILTLALISCMLYLGYWGYQYIKNIAESEIAKRAYTITERKTFLCDSEGLFDNAADVSLEDTTPLTDIQALKLLSKINILAIDHEALYKQNNDYIGWIAIFGTPISYPVYKSSDNADYLHHNKEHSYSYAGCIFMDCDNNSLDDFNVILHGHNMRTGAMFGSLKKYTSTGYYNMHPFVIFYPRAAKPKIYKVYSIYSKDISFVKNIAYKTLFSDKAEKSSFINSTKAMSIINTDQSIKTDVSILTLSTCTGNSDTRFIVQAYLFEIPY